MSVATSHFPILSGNKAFYCNPDYDIQAKREFSASRLPVSHTWTGKSCSSSENKVVEFMRRCFQAIASLFILPSSIWTLLARYAWTRKHFDLDLWDCERVRKEIALEGPWKYQRVTVQVGKNEIDAMLVVNPNVSPKRYVMAALGNAEIYEYHVRYGDPVHLAEHCEANLVLFNYPGVGASSGFPSQQAMKEACLGVMEMLEKKVEATEILCYGHSIGGGILADALAEHTPQQSIRYFFVASRTFSSLIAVICSLFKVQVAFPLSQLIRTLKWNITPYESLKKFKIPFLVLQTGSSCQGTVAARENEIGDDVIIKKEASLAYACITQKGITTKHEYLAIQEDHNDPLEEQTLSKISQLADFYWKQTPA